MDLLSKTLLAYFHISSAKNVDAAYIFMQNVIMSGVLLSTINVASVKPVLHYAFSLCCIGN